MVSKNKLCYLIADNFVAYYKAHTFHLNVSGPNFQQYHSLFGEIYEELWKWHDTLSELLRQQGDKYTLNLKDILSESTIDDDAVGKSVTATFDALSADLLSLLACAERVYSTGDPATETVIGEYCVAVSKLKWKINATIGK